MKKGPNQQFLLSFAIYALSRLKMAVDLSGRFRQLHGEKIYRTVDSLSRNECLITILNQRKLNKGEIGRFDTNLIEISVVINKRGTLSFLELANKNGRETLGVNILLSCSQLRATIYT